eukprot:CAMPEP_0173204882 /NCGR_PEP_ID=MMETSP1141-20130122/20400_1 /TAXON_ID=483371 /ORGANISM="non described non described, Strain CCMP2298" /LENGTH=77 /DNA_ID=CAMNT_0014130657 /DNA_START=197 /DNA_END=430 /DNA_ORIENTATION=-
MRSKTWYMCCSDCLDTPGPDEHTSVRAEAISARCSQQSSSWADREAARSTADFKRPSSARSMFLSCRGGWNCGTSMA